MAAHPNSFGARSTFKSKSETFDYFSLTKLADEGFPGIHRMPFSVRILLESVMRNENGREITAEQVRERAEYGPEKPAETERPFEPDRVLDRKSTRLNSVVAVS